MASRKISLRRIDNRSQGWTSILLGVQYRNLPQSKTWEFFFLFWLLRIISYK